MGLGACNSDPAEGCRTDGAADAPAVAVRVQHLETGFFKLKTPADARQFLDAHAAFAR